MLPSLRLHKLPSIKRRLFRLLQDSLGARLLPPACFHSRRPVGGLSQRPEATQLPENQAEQGRGSGTEGRILPRIRDASPAPCLALFSEGLRKDIRGIYSPSRSRCPGAAWATGAEGAQPAPPAVGKAPGQGLLLDVPSRAHVGEASEPSTARPPPRPDSVCPVPHPATPHRCTADRSA